MHRILPIQMRRPYHSMDCSSPMGAVNSEDRTRFLSSLGASATASHADRPIDRSTHAADPTEKDRAVDPMSGQATPSIALSRSAICRHQRHAASA